MKRSSTSLATLGAKRGKNTPNDTPKDAPAEAPADHEKSNGRSIQPTRAYRACDYCRKQKTRCFRSSPAAICCLRCLSVGIQCSFETAYRSANPGVKIVNGVPEHLSGNQTVEVIPGNNDHYISRVDTDHNSSKKLDFLCGSVTRILELLQAQNGATQSPGQSILSSDVKLLLDAASTMKDHPTPQTFPVTPQVIQDSVTEALATDVPQQAEEEPPHIILGPSKGFETSPFSLLADNPGSVSRPVQNLLKLRASHGQPAIVLSEGDIIDAGVLTKYEVVDLMNDFRSNYGRWVLFPSDMSTEDLIDSVRKKSSLLITTCCCLSLRYSLNGKPNPGDVDSHRRKKITYKLLIQHLLRDLNKTLLKVACFQGCGDSKGDIEDLQAMVILSIYSMSLSSIACSTVDDDPLLDDEVSIKELNMDSWSLSGTALTTFISKSNFGVLLHRAEDETPNFTFLFNQFDSTEYQTLTMYRIYNHLILNHLASCLFSGRMCIVDQIRLSHCNLALSLPSATNFDGRMVSEIGILLITYNYIQLSCNGALANDPEQVELAFKGVKEEIKGWYEQWEYLFSQPAISFVESTLSFCLILVHLSYTQEKVGASKRQPPSPASLQDRLLMSLTDCDRKCISQIISSAYYLVDFSIKIQNDSYYAYLSDQIHFFFYFGCVVLLKGLSHLKAHDKLHYLNDQNDQNELTESTWKDALVKSKQLVEKLTRICQDNTDDLLTNYRDSLVGIMQLEFPIELS